MFVATMKPRGLVALAWWGVACGPGTAVDGDGGGAGSGDPSSSSGGGRGSTASEGGFATQATAADDTSTGPGAADSSSSDSGEPTPEAACRNGVLDPYEECDDGNNNDDDACNNDCVVTAAIVWDVVEPAPGDSACAQAVAVGPGGEIAAGGLARTTTEAVNAMVAVFDADGVLQWSEDWDGGQQERDEVMAVAFDGAGDLYLAVSESNGPSSRDDNAWLYKRGVDGSARWSTTMEQLGVANVAADLVVGPDGGATLLARSFGPGLDPDLRLQRHTAAGELVWPGSLFVDALGVGAIDPSLGQDAAGDLYVVGGRRVDDFTTRAYVRRYALDGTLQWSVDSNPPPSVSGDRPVLGVTASDGTSTIILFDAFAPEDLVLRSWDAAGAGPSVLVPGVSAALRLRDATVDAAGNYLIVAYDNDASWTIKLDPTGARQWVRKAGQVSGLDAEVYAVAVAANDDVIVAGCAGSITTERFVWIRRYTP